jgi:hypothetical protein
VVEEVVKHKIEVDGVSTSWNSHCWPRLRPGAGVRVADYLGNPEMLR